MWVEGSFPTGWLRDKVCDGSVKQQKSKVYHPWQTREGMSLTLESEREREGERNKDRVRKSLAKLLCLGNVSVLSNFNVKLNFLLCILNVHMETFRIVFQWVRAIRKVFCCEFIGLQLWFKKKKNMGKGTCGYFYICMEKNLRLPLKLIDRSATPFASMAKGKSFSCFLL